MWSMLKNVKVPGAWARAPGAWAQALGLSAMLEAWPRAPGALKPEL
jgi:hypothetical protein